MFITTIRFPIGSNRFRMIPREYVYEYEVKGRKNPISLADYCLLFRENRNTGGAHLEGRSANMCMIMF